MQKQHLLKKYKRIHFLFIFFTKQFLQPPFHIVEREHKNATKILNSPGLSKYSTLVHFHLMFFAALSLSRPKSGENFVLVLIFRFFRYILSQHVFIIWRFAIIHYIHAFTHTYTGNMKTTSRWWQRLATVTTNNNTNKKKYCMCIKSLPNKVGFGVNATTAGCSPNIIMTLLFSTQSVLERRRKKCGYFGFL